MWLDGGDGAAGKRIPDQRLSAGPETGGGIREQGQRVVPVDCRDYYLFYSIFNMVVTFQPVLTFVRIRLCG